PGEVDLWPAEAAPPPDPVEQAARAIEASNSSADHRLQGAITATPTLPIVAFRLRKTAQSTNKQGSEGSRGFTPVSLTLRDKVVEPSAANDQGSQNRVV